MNCNMSFKSQIVTDLGVYELLIPRLINEALLANDRVKYFFSLLQMAKEHAEGHDDPGYLNSKDRRACGVDDDGFDDLWIYSPCEVGLHAVLFLPWLVFISFIYCN
jgi:hypothetical protein